MKSQWNDQDAPSPDDPLALRVYTSRLLGKDPDLVMHGGGNTSVKIRHDDFFGDPVDVLYVKGSGWDLATIEPEGFAPVRLDVLRRLAELPRLSDSDMVRVQRSAMLDPTAPGPSVEAILHAILPFRFVDHSHADAVVALSNAPDGEARIRELYGDSVLIIPYVMPGFILARTIYDMTRDTDWTRINGMVLMSHGVFTFDDDGRRSYERMIDMVDQAEAALAAAGALDAPLMSPDSPPPLDTVTLARARRRAGELRGAPVLARLHRTAAARGFAGRDDAVDIASRGPLTPDHVIRTKRTPVVWTGDRVESGFESFAQDYDRYFEVQSAAHGQEPNTGDPAAGPSDLQQLDPGPRWGLWRGEPGSGAQGTLAFGRGPKELSIISDIAEHTCRAIQWAEHLGGWTALSARHIFDVEYWELEQAKLKKAGAAAEFQGKVAWVTGAGSGIGLAVAEEMLAAGAAVVALDLDPAIESWKQDHGAALGIHCDVTRSDALLSALDATVAHFGGLDVVVSNAGFFPPSAEIEHLDDEVWQRSLDVNLTSHRRVLQATVPVLRHGFDPAVVVIASKNVPAPGPGAAAYSAAKAALTQLSRVAALELGADGIRVNVLHPNGVFDTALWTDEVLATRAESYGISVAEYKTNNVLSTEVTSRDVARAVRLLAGGDLRATTGAQLTVDGGNTRVI